MWISDTSIKRPVFATMVLLALVVLGLVSYPEIGVDLFPKVDFPIVSVTTVLKGASPEVVDIDVTDRIEEAINTINGVKTITSTSSEGVSSMIVEFQLERDIDLAVQDVREQIAAVRRSLPDDIDEPVIQKVNPDSTPILWLNLTGEKSIPELSTYADEILKEQLQRIEGVGSLWMGGLQRRQIRVWLDLDKLKAHDITPGEVAAVIGHENIELPGGRIESGTKEYSVKVKGNLRNAAEFNDLVVANRNGTLVRIRDIGRAEDGVQEQRSFTQYNGMPSVGIGIRKQTGTNTVQVIRRVKKELDRINRTLPPGMKINTAFDQSIFIQDSIDQVRHHLVIGSILAVVAVFIFLRNIRTTLISAVALPVSIISTFTLIRAFDFTFNNLTMLALTLSVGILIDDAIIVIENIYRHIEEGMAPREAASFATAEIGLAVMATTLAIMVIFLPVAFMKGIIGRFFMQFALTVVFSVGVSLLVSLTLTPMLSSIFLKPRHQHEAGATGILKRLGDVLERWYRKIEAAYRPILAFSLDHRSFVLIGSLVIFVFSMYMVRHIGKEFVPPEDQAQFIVRLEAPIDYSFDQARAMFMQAEKIVRDRPEVVGAFFAQGMGQGGSGQVNKAIVFTRLVPRNQRELKQHEIMAELRTSLNVIPGIKATTEMVSMLGGGIREVPIQYIISSGDMENLQKNTRLVMKELARVPGVVDVDTSFEAGKPELKVYIDRDKAADLGVSVASIADAVNLLISGEVEITKFKDETRSRRYDVRMRLDPEDRMNPDDLGRISVRSRTGSMVELSNLVHIEEGGGPTSISRYNRQRSIWVFANLENKPLAEAMDNLDAISARILPPDYSTAYVGQAETMKESFGFLMLALLLGIILAYMVLASQFESFMHPVTVLLAMPLSFIGAFGALLITGKTISIVSFIGLILLMGLVKKNSILLVDYTNTLRERGMSRREAILQAGPVRLRPILMTTFAMIFGMLPVALGIGEGSDIRSPMGIIVIGGLITSLFLTLAVVPAAYDTFDSWKEWLWNRMKGRGDALSNMQGGGKA